MLPRHRVQHQISAAVNDGPPTPQRQADKGNVIGCAAGEECLPTQQLRSCDFIPHLDRQKTPSQKDDTQQQQRWLAASFSLPVEEGPAVSIRSDSGRPEGWEHIRSDDTYAVYMCGNEAMQAERAFGNKSLLGDAISWGQEGGTIKASGSIAGWSSPSTEFEFVADAPWCNVRRLLRLSKIKQPGRWSRACSGLTSAFLRDRRRNAAEVHTAFDKAATEGEAGAAAADTQRAGHQGCPVVQLLRSAMYSSMLSGTQLIGRYDAVDEPPSGKEANRDPGSSRAILSDWGGLWQLTSVVSPRDSFSSCSSGERSRSVPVLPFALSCRDGESSHESLEDRFQSNTHLQQYVNVCDTDAARPLLPVGSSSLAVNSGTQRGTLPADEGEMAGFPDSAHVDSEVEASCSATEVSNPGEGGRSRDSARRLHGILLQHAQQHSESQCLRKLKKKDMRLNILIAALPGVDTDELCRQMFAEWQEVSRQRVSCGEEFVFRAPFVAPLVEVPVIAATSFAAVLPYCELRLLEERERGTVSQEEATERRVCSSVHVCLFLIPNSALPLSTGVLALLKRLRAVACMLPLLIAQQTASYEEILRDRGILRLQLAASDLATLEEMLLPLHSTPHAPEACAHCHKLYQPSEVPSESEPALIGGGFCNSDSGRGYMSSDGKAPDTHGPQTLKLEDYAESNNISSSSENASHASDGGCENYRRDDKLEMESAPASRYRCKMQSFSGIPLCLGAVHLPLVLHLPLSGTSVDAASRCTCKAGMGSCTEAVTTPLLLRGMLVEASAVLLRQRAEYGCFLPFLFQQQMLPNRKYKLRGLQQWEYAEKQQREQQQRVEALVDLRQGQIDSHPNADTAMYMQRQLNGLRDQLRKMQQQLVYLQERRFLQELLKEEAVTARSFPSPHGKTFSLNSNMENGEREELLSQMTQTGLVLALMLGFGAVLFNSMKRSC
ncbi:hypothetical protein, conserved [Eimeria praecox]|uniref:Uncharacterized protein n=1 Tax=Eimeria praecox TaxID=51316 RepID=U6GZ01_9EIME|nr:hypothetical protein, conserved [Eimeria praecox]